VAAADFSIYALWMERLGPHVQAVIEKTRRSGLSVDIDALGTTRPAGSRHHPPAVGTRPSNAFEHGATRVVSRVDIEGDETGRVA
jgi:hypothetical protein